MANLSFTPDVVYELGEGLSLPLYYTQPLAGARKPTGYLINQVADEYLVFVAQDVDIDPLIFREMLACLEADADLAALTVHAGSDSAMRLVLAPDMRWTVFRYAALRDSCGFDPAYDGLGDAVDWGWRAWSMGYRIGSLPWPGKLPDVSLCPAGLSEFNSSVLAWRNLLWTLAKNCERDAMGMLLSDTLMEFLAGVYQDYGSAVVPLPAGERVAKKSFWGTLRRLLFQRGDRLRIALDDADVPLAKVPPELATALVMANDVVEALPTLMDSHHWIQERRGRSDAQIMQVLGMDDLLGFVRQQFLMEQSC